MSSGENTSSIKKGDMATGAIEERNIADNAVSGDKLKAQESGLRNAQKVAIGTYDFDVNGGAQSTIKLGINVPDNAVIVAVYYDVVTQLTSAGAAKIAFDSEGAGDLLASALISSVGTAGLHDGIQDGTAANMIKTTGVKDISMTIADADLTGGKLRIYVEYVDSI